MSHFFHSNSLPAESSSNTVNICLAHIQWAGAAPTGELIK